MRQYVYLLRGGVILSNLEFAPSVDNRSVILSNYFLPSLAVEGTKAYEGGTNNPHCNANEFRPGWGGCRVVTEGVNPNTSNLVAMITSRKEGIKLYTSNLVVMTTSVKGGYKKC